MKPPECERCTLYSAPGPVWGQGDRQARLVYIAQNPGREEVQEGHPLVGPSGRVFNRQLAEAGIRRSELYITNQVKCLTPNNRIPTSHEANCCRHFLEKELKLCASDTVVLAGGFPFQENISDYSSLHDHYYPSPNIMNRQGCVEQKDGRKWIGTIHPAFVMRMPEWREAAVEQLKKAWRLVGVALPKPEVEIWPTDRQVTNYVLSIKNSSGEFSDDLETVQMGEVEEDDYVGGDWTVTMCGISGRPYHAMVIRPEQIHLLEPIFTDREIKRYEHNGEYDQYFLERYLNTIGAKRFDTMLGTHYLKSYAPKKLKPWVVSQYTDLPYYDRGLAKVSDPFYCGMDVITTLLAAREQKRRLVEKGLWDVFMEFGQPLLPVLEEWRRIGVKVDAPRALLFKRILEAKIARCNQLLQKINPYVNWNSPLQLKTLFYETWKLPKQTKRVDRNTTRLTTDYEARKKLRHWIEATPTRMAEYKIPYAALQLTDYLNGEEKKLEYIGRISPDGRIHAFYKAHGTESFRLSTMPNIQNWPIYDISQWGGARRDDDADDPTGLDKEEVGSLRSLIVPDHEDDLLLSCDFEQLQLWIMAKQFNVKWMLEMFEKREYIYGIVYEDLYKEPFFEPGKPKTKEFRLPVNEQRMRRAKAVPLGFMFNRTAKAVSDEYGWPESEGVKLRKWWTDRTPELQRAYSHIEFQVQQRGWVRHVFGNIMHFPNKKLSDAINSHAQSPEAFIMIGTILAISREFKRREYKNTRIMLSVHDSLTFNIGGARTRPAHLIEVYEEIVAPIMSRPISQLGGFQFRHSAEVSQHWDWRVTSYAKWKAANEQPTGAAGSHRDQSLRGEKD